MGVIEATTRIDIEEGLNKIQHILMPVIEIDPETVKDVDDVIEGIRGDLQLLYHITR